MQSSLPASPYHHGDLRAALLAQARLALEAGGDKVVSLRGLAASVGVSPNAPYRHFRTKEALLAALSTLGFQDLTSRFDRSDTEGNGNRLARNLQAYLDFARENPGLYRLMFGRDLDPLSCDPGLGLQATACFTALMAMVADVLERDMDDPRILKAATMVWSLSHGAALLEIDRATAFLSEDQRPDASDLARLLISGLSRAPITAVMTPLA